MERKQSQIILRRIQALLQRSINGKTWSWYHLTQRMVRQYLGSDRVMSIKLVVGKRMLNIISAYAPQTGCSQDEKEHFYEEMESLFRQIPGQEDMWIGADLNVGGTRTGFEREHWGNSWGDRNAKGEEILQFAQAYDLGVVNTFFQKKMEHLMTYKSGGRRSMIDYILIRRNNIRKSSQRRTREQIRKWPKQRRVRTRIYMTSSIR